MVKGLQTPYPKAMSNATAEKFTEVWFEQVQVQIPSVQGSPEARAGLPVHRINGQEASSGRVTAGPR
jgi:hypothetical protein